MKKLSVGLFIFSAISVFSQELPFDEVTFQSWTDNERKENIFSLLDDEMPSDEELYDLMTALLDRGGLDVNLRSKNGKQTIFDACLNAGRYKTARLFIEKGYKINQRCFECNGETPFLKAVYHSGNAEQSDELRDLMILMIEKGANPDLRDMKGYTSLHWAIRNNDPLAFDVLMVPEVILNAQLATLKGKGYLLFFDKYWNEDEYRDKLMEKTELKYPPTKKELKQRKKEVKIQAKEKKEKD